VLPHNVHCASVIGGIHETTSARQCYCRVVVRESRYILCERAESASPGITAKNLLFNMYLYQLYEQSAHNTEKRYTLTLTRSTNDMSLACRCRRYPGAKWKFPSVLVTYQ
ncbi:unnamed protein product, partial [Scytosiphon promiscuus]